MLSLTIAINNFIEVIKFLFNVSIAASFFAVLLIIISYHNDVTNYRLLFLLPIPIILIAGVSTANLRYKLKLKRMLRAATYIRNQTIRDHIPELIAIKEQINEYPLLSKDPTAYVNCFSTYGKDAVVSASYFYYEFSTFLYLKYCSKDPMYQYTGSFTSTLRYNHLHLSSIRSVETDTKIYDTQDLIL
jgi:hypothetical protein